ncbi:hypothetical protein J2752_000689 [Halarchaeum rubridurum]|uniref:Big-1 domain-containing protein n=1 Tax=Halarchaeum rubridurum TaxID=489911 RepID=A0A830FXU1_9EURY|nr:hypothetical protein [Halarchaeum rubridurum]MBP1953808.1 hypothetical protein [Halarchaeum rubridurum]GGM54864.1 hypothetical protein GCM10009017_01480 [Halarchaeum rubridurum]
MRDERAVAGLVGAILLFGMLVVALSLYQAQVVPSENARVEFDHSQQVGNDLVEVRNALLRTAWSGDAQPTAVSLGTRYPERAFALNPPPATGTLATRNFSGASTVIISNLTRANVGEGLSEYAGDDGALSIPTKRLVYTPHYNEYGSAPTTTYENTVLYDRFGRAAGERTLARTGQRLVTPERVSVVALTGEYTESGVGSVALDPEAVSAGSGAGSSFAGPVTVSVPTALPSEGASGTSWNSLVAADTTLRGDDGRLNVTLAPGTRLRVAAVSVGATPERASPAYLSRESRDATMAAGERRPFTVRVNDASLNPVEGVAVSASVAGDGELVDGDAVVTGADGTASFAYRAGPSDGAVTVWVDSASPGDPGSPKTTTFDVSVPDGGGSDGSGSDGSGDGSGDAATLTYNGDAGPYNGGNTIRFSMSANADATITGVNVSVEGAAWLWDESGGQPEVRVGNGAYDANVDDAPNSANDYYRLGTAVDLTSDATVSAGETVTVEMQNFRRDGNDRPGGSVDVQNERVRITFAFADGSTQTLSFTNGAY